MEKGTHFKELTAKNTDNTKKRTYMCPPFDETTY